MSRIISSLLCVIAVLAAFLAFHNQGTDGADPNASEILAEFGEPNLLDVRDLGRRTRGDWQVFNSDDFNRYVKVDNRPYRLIFESISRNPTNGRMERYDRSFSTSFIPLEARGITANNIFVAGYGRGDVLVFEQWQLGADAGTYYTTRTLPGTVIGVPVPVGNTVVSINGSYTSPSRMDNLEPLPAREELFRESTFGKFLCFDADPEGRYLLVASRGSDGISRLRQLSLNESVAHDVIFDQSTLGCLDGASAIYSATHEVNGFCWRIEGESEEGFLWDYDYDGVIDASENLSYEQSVILYPFDSFVLDI